MIIRYGSEADITHRDVGTVVTVIVGTETITSVIVAGTSCTDCVLNGIGESCLPYVLKCHMRKIIKASSIMEEL